MDKYEEALQKAKRLYEGLDGYSSNRKVLEEIFPELAESEDERMRTKTINCLIMHNKGCVDKKDIDECIAWLEKQKVNTDGDFARGYDCGYEACLHSHGAEWFEKQKEQKQEDRYMEGFNEGYKKATEEYHKGVSYHLDLPAWPPKIPDLPTQTTTNDIQSTLQPHWKPSEEQMENLEMCFTPSGVMPDFVALESLYNDLKKL